MPLSDDVKALINNAWNDGYPCLLATAGARGPTVGPKGSMLVFDDSHLAYWERTKRGVLENLGADKRVCVLYANFIAQRDGKLDSGFLRFYGTAELYESGAMHDAIFAKLSQREQTHTGATVECIAMVAPQCVCSALIATLSQTLNPGHCQRCGSSSRITCCRVCRRRSEGR